MTEAIISTVLARPNKEYSFTRLLTSHTNLHSLLIEYAQYYKFWTHRGVKPQGLALPQLFVSVVILAAAF